MGLGTQFAAMTNDEPMGKTRELDGTTVVRAPELLAPAGNWECAKAAMENGADAIYFGLQSGFNARARAGNFALDELPDLLRELHRRGMKGYVTLNTLVFTDELPALEETVRAISTIGVDAVLVQDVGVARLVREVSPDLPIHASTQMTMTSAETIQMAELLGAERVVLARELSLEEIRAIGKGTRTPLEVFVHGALCVAYSGQCLTSESLGGRSANRGQCAQACRLNYELICDDQPVELGNVQYLLSPQDLAAYDLIPELIEAGVCSFKIEGRLKTPEYVANIVRHYRAGIDRAMQQQFAALTSEERREMELSFSRGFSPGWLEGNNHKRLVPGTSSAKKGVLVGRVIQARGDRLEVQLDHPLKSGDGIVLEGDRAANQEFGGRIYGVYVNGVPASSPQSGRVALQFKKGTIRNAHIYPGQLIWQSDDPQLTKRLRSTFESEDPHQRVPLHLRVIAHVGVPISVVVQTDDGTNFTVRSDHVPEPARRHPASKDELIKQLGRLGGTVYVLTDLETDFDGEPMIPLSVAGAIRHEIVRRLDEMRTALPNRLLASESVHVRMLSSIRAIQSNISDTHDRPPQLHVLCRTLEQLRITVEMNVQSVYVDFHDIREYREAVRIARQHEVPIYLATLRIFKPGEGGLFRAMEKHAADGWLVRNFAAIVYARKAGIPAIGDFSLNVTNPISAQWFMDFGLLRCTASYDLNRDQLVELASSLPGTWLEVVVHQFMPMFHMEHCVFCSLLSPGTNKSNCGRPCDRHQVRLKDRIGVEHVLHADIGCRNTLYNGIAQSGAEVVADLRKLHIRDFRVELLRDAKPDEIRRLIQAYRDLLAGRRSGSEVWKELKAHNRVGVTRGTLEHQRDPLAIL